MTIMPSRINIIRSDAPRVARLELEVERLTSEVKRVDEYLAESLAREVLKDATIERVRALTGYYDLNSGSAYAYVAADIRAALTQLAPHDD